MNRLFDSHYEFSIGDDYRFPIDEYIPTDGYREHKHADVKAGIQEYTYNWEVIAKDDTRRRGSDKLFLVEDEHYIWCSRTGMESAGNVISMSASTPSSLRFSVLSKVFENVLERKFGDISTGIDKEEFMGDSLTVCSPREFVLSNELSQDELDAYYDEMADVIIQLIGKYNSAETVRDLASITDWYYEQKTQLFRTYTDFTPSIVSQVLPELNAKNGWRLPNDIDAGKQTVTILHTNTDYGADAAELRSLNISVLRDEVVQLVESVDMEDTILMEETYDTVEELEDIFDRFMSYTPENICEIK